jgi:hypothetical protein
MDITQEIWITRLNHAQKMDCKLQGSSKDYHSNINI